MKSSKAAIEATYQYNKAHDLITETLSRMTFLLESAPNNYTDQNFSREGLSGMGWLIGDVVDRLTEAQVIMSKLARRKTNAAG